MKKIIANSHQRFFMSFMLLGFFCILSCGGGSGDSDKNKNDSNSEISLESQDVSGEYTFRREYYFEATSYSIADVEDCINASEGTSEIDNFQLTQNNYEIVTENESSDYVQFIYEDLEYKGFYDNEAKTIEGVFWGTTTEENPITGCISTGTITGTFTLTRTPISILITGPAEVEEGEGAQYTCTAYYSNGSSSDVSSSARWSDDSTYASIDTDGYLTTTFVDSDQTVSITANYEGIGDIKSVTIVEAGLGDPAPEKPKNTDGNRCKDLEGELEMRVLVGPAEAVGLKPEAVANIPFSTECDDDNYRPVQGGGSIAYDETYGACMGHLQRDFGYGC